METIYLICAAVGGTLIVCQFLLTFIGVGAHHDVGGGGADVGHGDVHVGAHDAGGHDAAHDMTHDQGGTGPSVTNWIFGILTFRTIVAGMAFFGLTGLALSEAWDNKMYVLMASAVAGLLALFIVATVMRSLGRLNVDGTIRIHRAVGARGTVYLSIPAGNSGTGKVHVGVQGRTMEYKATTACGELPTGAKVAVVKVVSPDTVEVTPVESLERSGTV